MNEWLIDALCLAGISAATGGVYIEYGIGFAMIFGGLSVVALAVNAARLMNASNYTSESRNAIRR